MKRWTGQDVQVFRHDVLDESKLDFSQRVGCSVRSIERWETGGTISRKLNQALNEALRQAPEWAQTEFETRRATATAQTAPNVDLTKEDDGSQNGKKAGGSTKRRGALKLLGITTVAPTAVQSVLAEAAGEAMEFTRRAEASSLGSSTLEHLELTVITVNHAYSRIPPAQLFGNVHRYRRQIAHLLTRPHTLRQGRELYAHAGWLSELLAWLAHDLGNPWAAEAYCIDAWQHGWQAGHDELCAWAMDAKASIALYNNRPQAALSAALRGADHAPPSHPLAVRLHAQAARAHARLGQRKHFQLALGHAVDLHEALPAQTPTRFGVDTTQLACYAITSYAASSCIWLGWADQAHQHATDALQLYATAPAGSRSPSREAIARIDLALALAALDHPDEACALGHQALSCERLVDSIRARAQELDAVLQHHYPTMPQAAEFHEQCATLHQNNGPAVNADENDQNL